MAAKGKSMDGGVRTAYSFSSLALLVALTFSTCFLAGCFSSRITDTSRTAIEQLLLSTAADRALSEVDLSLLEGRKVFLDASNFESNDKGYALGAIRDCLNSSGAFIVDDRKAADVIVEPRSGALAIDRDDSLFGVPTTRVPIPLTGVIDTPEIALFKKISQESTAKFGIHAYEKETGKHLVSKAPLVGTAYYNRWVILLFISFRTTDIPEKRVSFDWLEKEKEAAKRADRK